MTFKELKKYKMPCLSLAHRAICNSIFRNSIGLNIGRSLATGSGRRLPEGIPDLRSFIQKGGPINTADPVKGPLASPKNGKRVYIETYGCAMNSSDTEIILSVLGSADYEQTDSALKADVILMNTCAIRDSAEQRVWGRLAAFKQVEAKRNVEGRSTVIGVLGCMAERLKDSLLENGDVDIVVGPDAYRDLPRLLDVVLDGDAPYAINTQLSFNETYGDIRPVRSTAQRGGSAFVSIMRGCNNMCSFCVVPFTRGRERSRSVDTVLDDVRRLADDGHTEVTLLGQNVNSYHDVAAVSVGGLYQTGYVAAAGFSNMFRSRGGDGVRFAELLDRVALAAPSMRVRFVSPHPKDFSDDVLAVIRERRNVCKQVHLPAQSGSTRVLASMRRGYSRESYLDLAAHIRSSVPGVSLSSDFISGFCGESEDDHGETLSLLRAVQFEQAYMFAYSLRERTHAAYHLKDDVPDDVKLRRLHEVIATFKEGAISRHAADVGSVQLVLVDGPARKSTAKMPLWAGRTDSNKRCVFGELAVAPSIAALLASGVTDAAASSVVVAPGQFVAVHVTSSGPTSLRASALAVSSIEEFAALGSNLASSTKGIARSSMTSL